MKFTNTANKSHVKFIDRLMKNILTGSGVVIIILLLLIVFFLVRESLPFFLKENLFSFLTGTNWNPTSFERVSYGILPLLVSTLFTTLGSMVIAVPVGIGTAIYLSEYAHGKLSEVLKFIIEILSSIPSVVIGFIGIVLIGPALAKATGQSNGLNALNGSVLIALMSLPTIISISTDSIRDVPKSLREASLALGGSKWETIYRVVLPAAKSGIIASFMLGIGRAIGETMTVLMATGNTPVIPSSFFESVRTITATIAIEMGEVAFGSDHFHSLFALGLVLFIMSFAVNVIADIMIHRKKS